MGGKGGGRSVRTIPYNTHIRVKLTYTTYVCTYTYKQNIYIYTQKAETKIRALQRKKKKPPLLTMSYVKNEQQ